MMVRVPPSAFVIAPPDSFDVFLAKSEEVIVAVPPRLTRAPPEEFRYAVLEARSSDRQHALIRDPPAVPCLTYETAVRDCEGSAFSVEDRSAIIPGLPTNRAFIDRECAFVVDSAPVTRWQASAANNCQPALQAQRGSSVDPKHLRHLITAQQDSVRSPGRRSKGATPVDDDIRGDRLRGRQEDYPGTAERDRPAAGRLNGIQGRIRTPPRYTRKRPHQRQGRIAD